MNDDSYVRAHYKDGSKSDWNPKWVHNLVHLSGQNRIARVEKAGRLRTKWIKFLDRLYYEIFGEFR